MDTTTLLYIGLAVIVVGVLVYQVVTSNSRRNETTDSRDDRKTDGD